MVLGGHHFSYAHAKQIEPWSGQILINASRSRSNLEFSPLNLRKMTILAPHLLKTANWIVLVETGKNPVLLALLLIPSSAGSGLGCSAEVRHQKNSRNHHSSLLRSWSSP